MNKQLYLFVTAILIQLNLIGQQAPPQGINYQAMVYVPYGNQQVGVNSAGQIPANTQNVRVVFKIENGMNGSLVYEETQQTVTDQYGMLTAIIGTGTASSVNPQPFNQINWGQIEPYLRVSINLTRYNTAVESYQKLWTVPYAFYAKQSNYSSRSDTSNYATNAGNGITGVIDNGNGTLTFNYYDGSSYTTPTLTGLGSIGPQGPAGANGTNGLSAYEIWLQQGNTGTQADFLNSITGPQGPQGPAGLTGPQGPTGGYTHSIGEQFGGGVIFYLWKDAQGTEHGLIVDLTDLTSENNPVSWSNITNSEIGLSAQSLWDGITNSNAIVSQPGHINSAAALCLNSTNGGQNDWYLPSMQELNLLWNNYYHVSKTFSQINGANQLKLEYLSSTEFGNGSSSPVFKFRFYSGFGDLINKLSTGAVRAIRAF
jgi:hypothetical protein